MKHQSGEVYKASAPSNIALIKYMGKSAHESNLPSNSSLSWTLNYLKTFVELIPRASGPDDWELLSGEGLEPMSLSSQGVTKFLNHLNRCKQFFGIENRNFLVRSANNFPSDCGLASSASSFAALTKAVANVALEARERYCPDREA